MMMRTTQATAEARRSSDDLNRAIDSWTLALSMSLVMGFGASLGILGVSPGLIEDCYWLYALFLTARSSPRCTARGLRTSSRCMVGGEGGETLR